MAKKDAAPPLANYLTKDHSPVHERFQKWVKEQTGYDADLQTIALFSRLYQRFQASPENKAGNAADREARNAEREQAKAAREAKKAEAQKSKDEVAAKRAEKAAAAKKAPAKKAAGKAAPAKAAAKKAAAPTKAATKPKPRTRRAGSTADF